MKKWLLLLLFIAAAWGFYEGADEGDAIQTKGRTAAEPPSSTARVTDFFHTVMEGVSDLPIGEDASKDTPAPEEAETALPAEAPQKAPTPRTTKPQGESSVLSDLNDLFHFKEAVERRLDRSQFVPSEDIPQLLKNAVVAAEDRRFYEHGAIDVMSVGRAAVANYMAGTTVEGGSTISQQTVKNLFLSSERTMSRKVRELFLAMQLENTYTKDQILEIYLNTIYFGHGAYGIGEACRTYFGKEPKDLTVSECAMIAGLPQAPSAYDPIDHPEEAKKRQAIVLMLMAREGYIKPEEAAKAGMEAVLK